MTTREPSAIDAIAEAYTTKLASLDPLAATAFGIKGYDHLMTAGWMVCLPVTLLNLLATGAVLLAKG